MKILFPILTTLLALLFHAHSLAKTNEFAITREALVTQDESLNLESQENLWGNFPTSFATQPLALVHQTPLNIVQPKIKSKLKPEFAYLALKPLIAEKKHQPEDALLTIEQNRAVQFNPGKSGFYPDIPKTIVSLAKYGSITETVAQAAGVTTLPGKQLGQTNTLGINDWLGRGRSSFRGSSKNRRTNIKVGMEKTKGVILAPGEVFSFNKFVGGVEAKDGFVPEIVIKKSGLAPELGGGLCQVSSTIFRGAVATGLAIKQRKNHSFAVSHYAPQGTDATTYTGVIDLEFINDTPGHLLIWPKYENDDTIVYDYYGTVDNRKVSLKDPVQYDRKSDGSLKANWERIVENNGETLTDNFKSVYLPPSQFKKVETFVPVSPDPQSPTSGSQPEQNQDQNTAPNSSTSLPTQQPEDDRPPETKPL